MNILLRQLIYLLQLILIFNGSANKRNSSFKLDKVETQILSFLDLVVSELPTFVILSHSPLSNTKSTLYSYALLYNVNNTRYIVHIILYTLHFILYTVHSTLYTVHCTLNTLYGILYTKHFILYTVHFLLLTLQCSLYTVHCTLHCTIIHLPFVQYCTAAALHLQTLLSPAKLLARVVLSHN